MSFFRNRLFLAVSLAHFFIDVFSSAGSVIVTFLSVPLGLSASQIGLAISAYQLVNGLVQPLFGWWVDRVGGRWLGPLSIAWTVVFMALSVFFAQLTGNYWLFLMLFAMAALGSAAFHPLGTMYAGTTISDRAATATAVFFLFGHSGLALGPVLAGVLLDSVGTAGIYGLALLVIPLVVFMAVVMRHTSVEQTRSHDQSKENKNKSAADVAQKFNFTGQIQWGAIGVLFLLIGLRSWAFLGTVAFLPKMFQDMGWSVAAYGSITGACWMAAAIMGVVAGNWADRWGRRQVIFITLLLGSIPLYFLPLNSGWLAFVLATLIGGLMGASHSILIVIAQDLLPSSKSLASGLSLGYLFVTGAIAAWAIGLFADSWSLTPIIQIGAIVGIASAFLAWLLPATRVEPERRELVHS